MTSMRTRCLRNLAGRHAEPEVIRQPASDWHKYMKPETRICSNRDAGVERSLRNSSRSVSPTSIRHRQSFSSCGARLGSYVHDCLDQGRTRNEVIEDLVRGGMDLKLAARIVGDTIEFRQQSCGGRHVSSRLRRNPRVILRGGKWSFAMRGFREAAWWLVIIGIFLATYMYFRQPRVTPIPSPELKTA